MQTRIKHSEHTPSPQPARGIYGFFLSGIFVMLTTGYALWILIPAEIIDTWPYQPPQKYWAASVPIFFSTALFLFAFFIYPSLHMVNDGESNDLSSITDRHALPPNKTAPHFRMSSRDRRKNLRGLSLKLNDGCRKDRRVEELRGTPIPSAFDLKIEDVCQLLYLQTKQN